MIAKTSVLLASLLAASSAPAPVTWVHAMADAKAKALADDKPILIYCWADGSDYCGQLYQETLAAEGVQKPLDDFVCYSAKHGQEGVAEIFDRYKVTTLPTMLFVAADGSPEDLIQGFIPAEDFVTELARIKRGEGTMRGLRARTAAARPGTEELMESRWLLAGKLFEFGDVEGQDELVAAIRSDDPDGKTSTGAVMLLNELVKVASDEGGEEVEAWDVAPIYAFAKSTKVATARFQAWNRLVNIEASRNDMQAVFAAARQAHKNVPEEQAFQWTDGMARWVIDHAEERTSKEKKFALEIATASVDRLKSEMRRAKKAGGEVAELEDKLARALNTQAWSYHSIGKVREAVAAAKRCVDLRDREDYRKDFEKISSED